MSPPMELSAAIELSFPASQNRFAGLTGPAIKGAERVARALSRQPGWAFTRCHQQLDGIV